MSYPSDRNFLIWRERLKGKKFYEIAAMFGLSRERTRTVFNRTDSYVRNAIYHNHKSLALSPHIDGVEITFEIEQQWSEDEQPKYPKPPEWSSNRATFDLQMAEYKKALNNYEVLTRMRRDCTEFKMELK